MRMTGNYRWNMCPKCHVKMQLDEDEPDLQIYKCPVCKGYYLSLHGELLKTIQTIADREGITINDLLDNALRKLERYK